MNFDPSGKVVQGRAVGIDADVDAPGFEVLLQFHAGRVNLELATKHRPEVVDPEVAVHCTDVLAFEITDVGDPVRGNDAELVQIDGGRETDDFAARRGAVPVTDGEASVGVSCCCLRQGLALRFWSEPLR